MYLVLFKKLYFLSFLFIYFSFTFLTSVDKSIIFFLSIIYFLFEKFYKRKSFISLISIPRFKNSKWLFFNIFIFTNIHFLMGLVHRDLGFDGNAYYLDPSNSFYILFVYLFSLIFLNVFKDYKNDFFYLKKYSSVTLAISFSLLGFITDFIIHFFERLLDPELNLLDRWFGSTDNPNIWAMQSGISVLLLIKVFYEKSEKIPRLFLIFISFFILLAVIISGSFTNILGVIFAIGSLFLSASWPLMIILLSVILVVNISLLLKFSYHDYHPDDLIFPINFLAHKIIPRMNLWSNLLEKATSQDFNYFYGMGYSKYKPWVESLMKNTVDHLHNIYYHYYFMHGIPGIYASLAYLMNIWKANKVSFAVVSYVLIISLSDASFLNYEAILMFFLVLALLIYSKPENL